MARPASGMTGRNAPSADAQPARPRHQGALKERITELEVRKAMHMNRLTRVLARSWLRGTSGEPGADWPVFRSRSNGAAYWPTMGAGLDR